MSMRKSATYMYLSDVSSKGPLAELLIKSQ